MLNTIQSDQNSEKGINMDSIKILGSGCPKCKKTAAIVEQVVKENNFDASIERVEEVEDMIKYNIIVTPAVVLNEKVMIKGRVPRKAEILKLLQRT